MWISSLYFQYISLMYIMLLMVIYFSKKRISNKETKIYSYLVITSFAGVLLDIITTYLAYVDVNNFILNPLCKLYLVYLLIWMYYLGIYIFYITENKKTRFVIKLYNLANIFFAILTMIVPLHNFSENGVIYTFGPGANLIYISVVINIVIYLIMLFRNHKRINIKKFIPVFAFVLLIIGSALIQKSNPQVLLVTSAAVFVTFLMYFTIENPDTKMIQELNQNRILIEKSNEDKSNFLFRMAQEVRQPIEDILKVNNIMKESKEPETIDKGIKYIEYSSKQLRSVVNNVLGISSIDSYIIKMMSNTYDVNSLFSEITSKCKSQINEKIDFRFNINQSIPEILYGDRVKIKQIISTLLENAIKHTEKGFIALNVDAITKNDVCRLIISVEDTGSGMSIDKVNELLSLDQELTEEDAKTLDKINLNLNIAAKIIKLLGGNILIKSEEGKGSEFILVIEQRVKKDETKINLLKQSKNLFKNKRVLLIDDSNEMLEEITKKLKEYKVEIVTTMYGSDCVEKIRTNQKFDLILIDDDMNPDTGLSTFQNLKKIEKFKTPVIIMLEKNKDSIKEHYLEEGFKDYLLKFKLETEIKRIANKYL